MSEPSPELPAVADPLMATGRYALYRTPDGGLQLLVDTYEGRDENGAPKYSEKRTLPVPPMILQMASAAQARFNGGQAADPMAMINGLLSGGLL